MTTYPPDYCPYCGDPLAEHEEEGRTRRHCEACGETIYHNPVPGAGVVVVDGAEVLLVKRAAEPWLGEWSIPGGHVETGESPAAAAARELEEETGLTVAPDRLRLATGILLPEHRDKHVVSFGYAVTYDATDGTPRGASDAAAARFFDRPGIDDLDPVRPYVEDYVSAAFRELDR